LAADRARIPDTTQKAPATKAPPAEELGGAALNVESKEVGRYVSPEKGPPSVLLQRPSGQSLWGQLRPEDRIATGNYLLSLPGYRSKVYLDSGVHMTLWGDLPEFSSFPPVLESVVMLHAPGPNLDLEFTLDRGRVLLANYKPTGAAQVRLRFQQQVWDLTLPDTATEVVVELWGLYPPGVPFRKDAAGKGPLECLGVFVKGQALLKIRGHEHKLPNNSQFTWTNQGPAPAGPQPLEKLPGWWTDRIEPQKDQMASYMMLALTDYSALLRKSDSVIDTVLTQTRESPDGPMRVLGVLFLAALDDVPHVVDALEDRQHPEVRIAAAHALRQWMSRNGDQDLDLYRTLYEKKGYSKEKAEIIMRLLHSFSEAELADPKTFEMLIGYLNHDNLAVRELAVWHLSRLAPDGSKIGYDPAADSDKRAAAVEQWKQLIPAGKVPPGLNAGSGRK
jgi:hypothetical protein